MVDPQSRRWRRGLRAGAVLSAGALGLASAVAVPSARAAATTWYVSSTGSGAGCTQASPCATITQALANSSSGDRIDVVDALGGGTDSEALDIAHDVTLYFGASQTLSGAVTIESGSTATFGQAPAVSAALSGPVSGGGGLVENGSSNSQLSLTGTDSYTGATSVLVGTLRVDSTGGLSGSPAMTVAQGGVLLLQVSSDVASLSGGGLVIVSTVLPAAPNVLTVDSGGLSAFEGTVYPINSDVALAQAGSALVTQEPAVQQAAPGGTVTLTAKLAANPAGPPVQWQVSTDRGLSWVDQPDGAGVTSASSTSGSITTATLQLGSLTASESGSLYRAVFTVGSGPSLPVTTRSAAVWVTTLVTEPPAPLENPPAGVGLTPVMSFDCGADSGLCLASSYTDPVTKTKYTVDPSSFDATANTYTVSGYEVDLSTVTPAAPAGFSYTAGFAVAWCSPNEPSDCTGTGPGTGSVVLTISDPAIQPGDVIYEVIPGTPNTLHPAGTAGTSGTTTVSFTDDPVFVVAHANPPPVGYSPPTTTTTTSTTTTLPPGPKLIRLGGVDRIATAVAISQYDFPATGSARAVVVGRDDLFADDLAGSPFAAYVGGPLLLTDPSYLDPRTAGEIARILPAGGTVYVLGDTSALSEQVARSVAALGYQVVRVGGPDRWATAVDVAQAMGNPATVFEADGTTPGGAVSAAPAAIATHGAILLTAGGSQAPATAAYLAQHAPATRYAVGSLAAGADPSATALAGTDEDATSVVVAQRFFPNPTVVGLATDGVFPDALTGASTSEAGNGPDFLVPTNGPLPPAMVSYLASHPSITTVFVYGGTAAVSDAVANAALGDVG